MPDIVSGLFVLVALLALCDVCLSGSQRKWVEFAVWTCAAILTKESAFFLVACALLSVVWFKSRFPIASPRLWRYTALAAVVLAILAGIYQVSHVWQLRSISIPNHVSQPWRQLPLLASFFRSASPVFFVVALYGVWRALTKRKTQTESPRAVHSRVALLCVVTVLCGQLMLRDMVEARYFMAAMLGSVLLFAEGLAGIQEQIEKRFGTTISVVAAVAVIAVCFVSTSAVFSDQRTGYRAIAAAIPRDPEEPVILVASDASGEGALIAGRLVLDLARAGIVLRATKMLETSDWMGFNTKLLVNSKQDVEAFLHSTPVNYIVLDVFGSWDATTKPVFRLLEQTVRGDSERFRLIGEFPLYLDGHRVERAVQVFENLSQRGHRPQRIQIHMEPTLGRVLTRSVETSAFVPRRVWGGSRYFSANIDRLPRREERSGIALVPKRDEIDASGGSGKIFVSAPAGSAWSFAGIPDWFEIAPTRGAGDALLRYHVPKNSSNQPRSVTLAVASKIFEVTQPQGPHISVPYFETFTGETFTADADSNQNVAQRWVVNDQSAQHAQLRVSPESPGGGNSLILEKSRADKEAWTTQVYLPHIESEEGAGYRLSLWLRAENPAVVLLKFEQSEPPYGSCGLAESVWVPADWTQFTFRFHSAAGCGADRNRLSIEAGWIPRRLWLSKVALVRDAP